jgi:hypothetical protein
MTGARLQTLNSAAKNAAYIGIEADDLNPKRNRGMLLLEGTYKCGYFELCI